MGEYIRALAFKHPRLFPVAAAISPALDYHELYGQGTPLDEMYDSKEQCRQDTALMHVPPFDPPPHLFFCIDPDDRLWYRGNDRLHEKLGALGVPHTCDLTARAGGHSWQYFNHMAERAIRFVYAGLEAESLFESWDRGHAARQCSESGCGCGQVRRTGLCCEVGQEKENT